MAIDIYVCDTGLLRPFLPNWQLFITIAICIVAMETFAHVSINISLSLTLPKSAFVGRDYDTPLMIPVMVKASAHFNPPTVVPRTPSRNESWEIGVQPFTPIATSQSSLARVAAAYVAANPQVPRRGNICPPAATAAEAATTAAIVFLGHKAASAAGAAATPAGAVATAAVGSNSSRERSKSRDRNSRLEPAGPQ